MYKVFTNNDAFLGRFGNLPANGLNHFVVDENDLNHILNNSDKNNLRIYGVDDNQFYKVDENNELVPANDPTMPEPEVNPITAVDSAEAQAALTDTTPATPPVTENTPTEENTAPPPAEENNSPTTDTPPVEHHDELTPGEKMALSEQRAENTGENNG